MRRTRVGLPATPRPHAGEDRAPLPFLLDLQTDAEIVTWRPMLFPPRVVFCYRDFTRPAGVGNPGGSGRRPGREVRWFIVRRQWGGWLGLFDWEGAGGPLSAAEWVPYRLVRPPLRGSV